MVGVWRGRETTAQRTPVSHIVGCMPRPCSTLQFVTEQQGGLPALRQCSSCVPQPRCCQSRGATNSPVDAADWAGVCGSGRRNAATCNTCVVTTCISALASTRQAKC